MPQFIPPPPADAWLGLAYNSSSGAGGIRQFAAHGVVFDRSGGLEASAGHTLENSARLADGVDRSFRAGMVPDVEIDPATGPMGCVADPNATTRCLPQSPADIQDYVAGFTATAGSVLRAYPGRRILFEPMNEPWNWASPAGTLSGRKAATEYARILAHLLPAIRVAGIPLGDVYVPATGVLMDGTSWVHDLYMAQPCLVPGASSCGPVGGWNLHPYGLPGSNTEGIDSVPGIRQGMRSGEDNIVVSEIGFCSRDVQGGKGCDQNQPDIAGSNLSTAVWLRDTLHTAMRMRAAGWLKALLIWDRAGDGWSMEYPDGSLTPQGDVLLEVASGSTSPPLPQSAEPGGSVRFG